MLLTMHKLITPIAVQRCFIKHTHSKNWGESTDVRTSMLTVD